MPKLDLVNKWTRRNKFVKVKRGIVKDWKRIEDIGICLNV